MQHTVAAIRKTIDRAPDLGEEAAIAQIDGDIDLGRHLGDEEEFALVGPLQHHRAGAGARQKLAAQAGRQLPAARLGEGQDRDLGQFDMVFQKSAVIARDGREEDHRLGDHHEGQRQKQQPSGEAMRNEPPGVPHACAQLFPAWPS